MKIFLFILASIALSINVNAGSYDSEKTELMNLMNERKILADEYYSSLESKSGFFGNRTKNDLRDSQEKLVEIVRIDNKIMDALNRSLNFKNFEKQNMSYDVNNFEERIKNLSILNDTLTKQNVNFSRDNKVYRSVIKGHRIYFAGLFLLLILAAWTLIKNKIWK